MTLAKLKTSLWYANAVYKAGDEIELPDDIAATLAAQGSVELKPRQRRTKADAGDS